ncbi:hypothetical protein BU17DRAFT_98248 [Hysterangium stoloniferum]|nr:hypothetical protein BU17DRAFT_98248 [Hysterangium stoloniferum]
MEDYYSKWKDAMSMVFLGVGAFWITDDDDDVAPTSPAQGHLDVVQALLAHGADPNVQDGTALSKRRLEWKIYLRLLGRIQADFLTGFNNEN